MRWEHAGRGVEVLGRRRDAGTRRHAATGSAPAAPTSTAGSEGWASGCTAVATASSRFASLSAAAAAAAAALLLPEASGSTRCASSCSTAAFSALAAGRRSPRRSAAAAACTAWGDGGPAPTRQCHGGRRVTRPSSPIAALGTLRRSRAREDGQASVGRSGVAGGDRRSMLAMRGVAERAPHWPPPAWRAAPPPPPPPPPPPTTTCPLAASPPILPVPTIVWLEAKLFPSGAYQCFLGVPACKGGWQGMDGARRALGLAPRGRQGRVQASSRCTKPVKGLG